MKAIDPSCPSSRSLRSIYPQLDPATSPTLHTLNTGISASVDFRRLLPFEGHRRGQRAGGVLPSVGSGRPFHEVGWRGREGQGDGVWLSGMPVVLALPDTIYFPSSSGIEMCIDAYLQQVSAGLSGEAQLGALVPVSPEPACQTAQPPFGPSSKPCTPVRAGPGHLCLCGYAAALGALHATDKALTSGASWGDEFRRYTNAAASALTPIGGRLVHEALPPSVALD